MSLKRISEELRVLGETDLADQVDQVVALTFGGAKVSPIEISKKFKSYRSAKGTVNVITGKGYKFVNKDEKCECESDANDFLQWLHENTVSNASYNRYQTAVLIPWEYLKEQK